MRVLDPGHVYLAEGVGGVEPRRIDFVKNRGERYPGNVGEPHGGILCQELLRILIDRTAYMNGQGSCAETEHALAALRQALAWYEVRAARCRGEHIALVHADELEREPTCPVCGQVGAVAGSMSGCRERTARLRFIVSTDHQTLLIKLACLSAAPAIVCCVFLRVAEVVALLRDLRAPRAKR